MHHFWSKTEAETTRLGVESSKGVDWRISGKQQNMFFALLICHPNIKMSVHISWHTGRQSNHDRLQLVAIFMQGLQAQTDYNPHCRYNREYFFTQPQKTQQKITKCKHPVSKTLLSIFSFRISPSQLSPVTGPDHFLECRVRIVLGPLCFWLCVRWMRQDLIFKFLSADLCLDPIMAAFSQTVCSVNMDVLFWKTLNYYFGALVWTHSQRARHRRVQKEQRTGKKDQPKWRMPSLKA